MKKIIVASLMVAASVHAADTSRELPETPTTQQIYDYQNASVPNTFGIFSYEDTAEGKKLLSADFHSIWWPKRFRLYAYKGHNQRSYYCKDTLKPDKENSRKANYKKWHVHPEHDKNRIDTMTTGLQTQVSRENEEIRKKRNVVLRYALLGSISAVSTGLTALLAWKSEPSPMRAKLIIGAHVFAASAYLSSSQARDNEAELRPLVRENARAKLALKNITQRRSPEESDFKSEHDSDMYNWLIRGYDPYPDYCKPAVH